MTKNNSSQQAGSCAPPTRLLLSNIISQGSRQGIPKEKRKFNAQLDKAKKSPAERKNQKHTVVWHDWSAQKFLQLRFFFSSENYIYDPEFWDYGISHSATVAGKNILHCMSSFRHVGIRPEDIHVQASLAGKTKFCVYLHRRYTGKTRMEFYKTLSRYRRIDALGYAFQNATQQKVAQTNWKANGENFNAYKFVIAFENSYGSYYLTEKILMAMMAGCVPIYWGSHQVMRFFNPARFINAYDFENLESLVQYVLRVDSDDKLYQSYLAQPVYKTKNTIAQHETLEAALVQNLLQLNFKQCHLPCGQANILGREVLSRLRAEAMQEELLREKHNSTRRRENEHGTWPFF